MKNAYETSGSSPTSSPWMTASEAAAYLSVKQQTLLMWARQGKVQGFTLSGTKRHVWRFRARDLNAALVVSSSSPSIALELNGGKN